MRRVTTKVRRPAALPNGIQVSGAKEVSAYLRKHRALARILPRICESARREFGEEADLGLKIYHDPEIDDHHLLLRVRLPSYANGLLGRLERVTSPFDKELTEASGWLSVNTDFCPPGSSHGF